MVCTINKLRIEYPCFPNEFKAHALYARTINRGKNYNPGQNVLGHLRKLGAMRHFAKLTHILPLQKSLGCCYERIFLLSPSPPNNVDCVELKLECITSTLHRGGRGEERCHIFTSYCVSVPRVLTRVVGPQFTVQLWQIRGLYARKEATNNCFTNKTVWGYIILTKRVM